MTTALGPHMPLLNTGDHWRLCNEPCHVESPSSRQGTNEFDSIHGASP